MAAPITTMTFRALDGEDPDVADLIRKEYRRQSETLELIASENLASPAVLEALGTLLTNKYAEGYPGRRYYGGTGEVIDKIETLAVDRAKELFGAGERPAALGVAGQRRRLPCGLRAGRQGDGHGPLRGRSPFARQPGQLQREVLRNSLVWSEP